VPERKASAASVVVGVIGTPVKHSLSPLLHQAGFHALSLTWVSVGFEVKPKDLASAIEGARALCIRGLSVTMPHKEAILSLVDAVTPIAKRLGAINCVSFEETSLVGLNTDGQGFLDALERALTFNPKGMRCGVIGAGGAARAVIAALGDAGAKEVGVLARNPEAAKRAASLAGASGTVLASDDLRDVDLVVQATPVGMASTDQRDAPPLFAGSLVHAGQVAVDLIYHPRETTWLSQARANGATTMNGLGMLVHQAARQIERWCGKEAPIEAMWAAVSEQYSA